MNVGEKIYYNTDLWRLINTYIKCQSCKKTIKHNRWEKLCNGCEQKKDIDYIAQAIAIPIYHYSNN